MWRFLTVLLVCLLLLAADWPRARPRTRSGVHENRRAAALVSPTDWAEEPQSPEHVDATKLAKALRALCGQMPPGRAESYAQWLVSSAQRHGEDPFLIAALAYRMSRCLPDARTAEGIGLTGLQPAMYRENVLGKRLRYGVLENGTEVAREFELPKPFLPETLVSAETNIEWAAALLAMWREQHARIDQEFPQEAHRHYLSHFVWGDRVRSARAEDRIFTDRRRLLLHYGVPLPEVTRQFHGVPFGPPLEGYPRVVSSRPGADRDDGMRKHRGVDVEAVLGEPVLAMADGTVSFSGVDLPGMANSAGMPPSMVKRVPRRKLGHGGRYVCIQHIEALGDELWLRTCYMHLEDVFVGSGQRVKRGQVIGSVGRTGMVTSAPHLHLEVKSDKRLYDARNVITDLLLGDPPADVKRRRRRHAPVEQPAAVVNTVTP